VRSQSAFARAIGVAFSGTTKAQHEATKKLEDAFKRLNTANRWGNGHDGPRASAPMLLL